MAKKKQAAQAEAPAEETQAAVAVQDPPKAEATKKEPPARDSLGCRVGSQAATINAAIGPKAKTATAIAEETGLPLGRVKSHLKFVVGKELVVESDDGFAKKPKAK